MTMARHDMTTMTLHDNEMKAVIDLMLCVFKRLHSCLFVHVKNLRNVIYSHQVLIDILFRPIFCLSILLHYVQYQAISARTIISSELRWNIGDHLMILSMLGFSNGDSRNETSNFIYLNRIFVLISLLPIIIMTRINDNLRIAASGDGIL